MLNASVQSVGRFGCDDSRYGSLCRWPYLTTGRLVGWTRLVRSPEALSLGLTSHQLLGEMPPSPRHLR
ncbi:hypothetical protein BRADI_4g27196v3 [Brachypodium distachyon]|uniref:Uncharacterized protein n=1 Tax=Brachypodium distachyon TaxID=15368 RepID=A0A2K2CQJ1_BRADI|nr:hypothetical protein BRADI_4g27196v3 [Brachypodium distachyon]PNT64292.1 hypothetical protein BRADI_4g27196v3 [Brachypodium distachyon]